MSTMTSMKSSSQVIITETHAMQNKKKNAGKTEDRATDQSKIIWMQREFKGTEWKLKSS